MGPQYFILTGHIAPLTQVHGVVVPAVEVAGIHPRIAETDILGINQSVSIPVILAGRTSLGRDRYFTKLYLQRLSHFGGGLTFLLILVGNQGTVVLNILNAVSVNVVITEISSACRTIARSVLCFSLSGPSPSLSMSC